MKLKCAKRTVTASSCHFATEDFARRHCFGSLKQQRTLIKDETGILPILRYLGLVSLFKCEMPSNWNFITYFATGFPTYYELYFHLCSFYDHFIIICCCDSVDFERSNASINTTITWWSFVSCLGVNKFLYYLCEQQPADLRSRLLIPEEPVLLS